MMGIFAWRNLLTRPLRTILALVGLSIPILGVLGLFCLSNGLRDLVGETLSRIEGMIILREMSPARSSATYRRAGRRPQADAGNSRGRAGDLGARPHDRRARDAASAAFCPARRRSTRSSTKPVIAGQDIVAHQNLGVRSFPGPSRKTAKGVSFSPSDEGSPTS